MSGHHTTTFKAWNSWTEDSAEVDWRAEKSGSTDPEGPHVLCAALSELPSLS